jgi:alpha-N-arabinofuranosidase
MLPTQLVIKHRQKAMRLRGLMKKAIGLRLLLVILLLLNSSAFAANGTITIDATKPGARIPSSLYGIFFEEISHAGEGGLYGELIQNRGFEDANLPPACKLENGFLIPPRTPHFWNTPTVSDWKMRWNVKSEFPAWSIQTSGGSAASLALVDSKPLKEATPHSLQINIANAASNGRVAVLNEGFWGIAVRQGEDYRLSFYARADKAFRGPLTVALESKDGKVLATHSFKNAAGEVWRKYECKLRASSSDPKAQFVMTFGSAGTVWLDFVSLFPAKTFRNRTNGLRADLAQMVADLKPAFVRWPGGCFVEGIAVETRPQWKKTIGPLEERPGTYSPWGYWSTDGFGYHEFLQYCEDIGADALYVTNVGISCAFRSGTFLDDEHLPELIQDTLDAIEYAIGPVSSKWGAVRAKNGHAKPFSLKVLEVGNEQQGAKYGERVAKFTQAIKAKYPQIKVALSSWIAGIDERAIAAAGKIDIVDEHAYKPLHWAIENFDSFAKYKRGDWELYIGEFACNTGVGRGNLLAALNDSAYMMSMEKNSDLVKMGSYAPLLENVNHLPRNWEVNLIHFDSSRIYGRGSYYACKLFAENLPDVNLATTVQYAPPAARPIAGRIGIGTWNTSSEYKDIRVERDGRTLYESDFSKNAEGWTPETGRRNAGTWVVEDGVYRQKDQTVAWSYFGNTDWNDVTVTLKARKIKGAEGFLVSAGYADGRRVQFNIGGWNNTQHAVQVADAIVGGAARGKIEEGRWYDIKLEVKDRQVRCYLDGQLIKEVLLPRVDTVLAIAGKDEATGDIVLKVMNSSPEPASMSMVINGETNLAAEGKVTVLTSANPQDENSFEQPTKIAPVSRTINGIRAQFAQEFPAYSLSVMRLKTRK